MPIIQERIAILKTLIAIKLFGNKETIINKSYNFISSTVRFNSALFRIIKNIYKLLIRLRLNAKIIQYIILTLAGLLSISISFLISFSIIFLLGFNLRSVYVKLYIAAGTLIVAYCFLKNVYKMINRIKNNLKKANNNSSLVYEI